MTKGWDHWITSRSVTVLIVAAVFASVIASVVVFPRIEGAFFLRAQDDSTSTLRLVSGAIDQAIGRYDPIPELVAGDPKLRELLREAENEGLIPFVNEKLRHRFIFQSVFRITIKILA